MGLLDKMMELVYPPSLYCSCCGNIIDSTRTYNLCDHCITHVRWDTSEEPRLVSGLKMFRCTEYGIYERTLIFGLKYNRKRFIARDIGRIMADRLAVTGMEFDVIVPVPLHKEKERERGFNQAALMGKYLGKELNIPCVAHGLVRCRKTRAMRGLSPTERAENIRNSFQLNPVFSEELSGKRILLIDDFYTTGSTAGECARALQPCNPEDIVFLAFAAKY
ncbi:MAG: ComF family protein [Emergencia sp.]